MVFWKDIPGYIGSYQISNFGEIRSLSRHVNCNGRLKRVNGRILKPVIGKYQKIVTLYKDGVGTKVNIQKLLKFTWGL